ncbi:30S ribosomal protein S18 [Candidatus Peregrinibacteria bacterium]|nr:30S ribosomal protein S18 [Candidatus Peregrinibacteria bacterium]
MKRTIFSTAQKHVPGKRRCTFCTNQMKHVDYKDMSAIRPFVDFMKRIKSSYYTGVCLNHQKELSRAIKRARFMATLPYVQ